MSEFRCKVCGGSIGNFTIMKYFRDGNKEIGPFHEQHYTEGKKRYLAKKTPQVK